MGVGRWFLEPWFSYYLGDFLRAIWQMRYLPWQLIFVVGWMQFFVPLELPRSKWKGDVYFIVGSFFLLLWRSAGRRLWSIAREGSCSWNILNVLMRLPLWKWPHIIKIPLRRGAHRYAYNHDASLCFIAPKKVILIISGTWIFRSACIQVIKTSPPLLFTWRLTPFGLHYQEINI